jgi:hypothetical protein
VFQEPKEAIHKNQISFKNSLQNQVSIPEGKKTWRRNLKGTKVNFRYEQGDIIGHLDSCK